jgi:hypothetical protein
MNSSTRNYQLYGINVKSNFTLETYLLATCDASQVTFMRTQVIPLKIAWGQLSPIYSNVAQQSPSQGSLYIYRLPDADVLRYADKFDFYVSANSIHCHLHDPQYENLAEIHLLGTIICYWLEQQGILTLHASAAIIQDKAVAFLSHSGNGKSTLAVNFLTSGHALLTDDILPVEKKGERYWGRPGFPQLRLWPQEARHFFGTEHHFDQVIPTTEKKRIPLQAVGLLDRFCNQARPLGCIYLPEKVDPAESTAIQIKPVTKRDVVMELVKHSFVPRSMHKIGLQPARLEKFAQIAEQIPVRRLIYPSGYEHLPRVRDAILVDLAR